MWEIIITNRKNNNKNSMHCLAIFKALYVNSILVINSYSLKWLIHIREQYLKLESFFIYKFNVFRNFGIWHFNWLKAKTLANWNKSCSKFCNWYMFRF
jgi:hypothetical protein